MLDAIVVPAESLRWSTANQNREKIQLQRRGLCAEQNATDASQDQ